MNKAGDQSVPGPLDMDTREALVPILSGDALSGVIGEKIHANHRLLIRDRGRWWFLPAGQIRLFESIGNHTYLFAGEKIRVPRSLKEIQERLDPVQFIRANRKHIVNLSHITGIADGENGGLMLTIDQLFKIPMVRTQATRLRHLFGI